MNAYTKQWIAGVVIIVGSYLILTRYLTPTIIIVTFLAGIVGLMVLVDMLDWNSWCNAKRTGYVKQQSDALNEIASLIYYQSPLKEQDRWLENVQGQPWYSGTVPAEWDE